MRNNALIICCGVCVAGAFGVFTRWIQNLTAFDEEGLYISGSFWGWALLLLCLAAAALLAGALWFFRNREGLVSGESFSDAHSGGGALRRAAYLAIAALTAVACAALLVTAGSSKYSVLLRVLALLGLLADGGFLGMAAYGGRSGRSEAGSDSAGVCLASVLPVDFCCFWLVVSYRQDAATAVVWRYGPEIAAIACSLLAFYYVAGHAFGRPKPYSAMFFCGYGAFLCLVTLPDERLLALQLLLAGCASMQLFFLWSLSAGLRRPETAEAEELISAPGAEEDGAAPPAEEYDSLADAVRSAREDERLADSFVEYDPRGGEKRPSGQENR